MQIISYETAKNIATVGFKVNDFVVYAATAMDSQNKEEIVQQAYKQAKNAIEYELTQGEHSFVTDEIGEEFTPDEPYVEQIEIETLSSFVFEEGQETASVSLAATVYDQYGDEYNAAVEWSATTGTIENSRLNVTHSSETETVTVKASAEGVVAESELTLYPYVKTVYEKTVEQNIEDIQNNMDNAVLELTMLIAMGGMPNV